MRARRSITAFSCLVLAGTPAVLCAHGSVALNSEWQNNRSGSIAGSAAVPSLVDANGFFFASTGLKSMRRPVE